MQEELRAPCFVVAALPASPLPPPYTAVLRRSSPTGHRTPGVRGQCATVGGWAPLPSCPSGTSSLHVCCMPVGQRRGTPGLRTCQPPAGRHRIPSRASRSFFSCCCSSDRGNNSVVLQRGHLRRWQRVRRGPPPPHVPSRGQGSRRHHRCRHLAILDGLPAHALRRKQAGE
jgi:hypothetical protein